jgi:hypothetical protein
VIGDPNIIGEEPASEYIASIIVTQLLPTMRKLLETLSGLQKMWHVNEMPEQIDGSLASAALLAGFPAAVWAEWGTTLTSLQVFLATPRGELDKTPTEVLYRRYTKQSA